MKTNSIILVLSAMLFVCGHTRAQDDLPYRPFQAFNNDTIRYLDYNFTIRNDQYVDKTVGDLLRDLELPVIYISNIVMQIDRPVHKLVGLNLVIRLVRDVDWDESKDYYIKIGLQTPVDYEDFFDALATDKRNSDKMNERQYDFLYWTPQLYELIKDNKLGGISANDCLFPDRRKLRETNTWEDIELVKRIIETEKANWRNKIRTERQAREK